MCAILTVLAVGWVAAVVVGLLIGALIWVFV